MSERVYFRGGRSEARAVARSLVALLVGREPDRLGVARGVLLSVGLAALSDIAADYVRKARGLTGEDGVKWQPLKPETIARRRVGPRDMKDASIKEREQIRQAAYKRHLKRLLLSLPPDAAAAKAKQLAGQEATRRTGKTKVQTLGGRQVEMLRDTGVLLNSLSPGQLSSSGPDAAYTPPGDEGGEAQVLETLAGGVIVGTTVEYAATHQYGDRLRGIPARPFLPEREAPLEWRERWARAAERALQQGAKRLYEAGS